MDRRESRQRSAGDTRDPKRRCLGAAKSQGRRRAGDRKEIFGFYGRAKYRGSESLEVHSVGQGCGGNTLHSGAGNEGGQDAFTHHRYRCTGETRLPASRGVTDEWIKTVKVEKVPGGQVDPDEDLRL